ncbi:P-loop containing nucleoside triphosphate hydrolase protein [Protomyces lactucae-debilis]|uniref:Elongation factor 1 alpha-like protein n=1 Tax=Protomyces lactucae-debilis TaxID=2754530 RepID=A0A1Y2FD95_PROLT|nr:P-loop containing nucleoside triphosphate hydrolase protein [Protomyces lactucae-debilis]ORY81394.1 P-loop containing nucleoside triphosphate hydrolase protein [Protomyces lactucae-debilis]
MLTCCSQELEQEALPLDRRKEAESETKVQTAQLEVVEPPKKLSKLQQLAKDRAAKKKAAAAAAVANEPKEEPAPVSQDLQPVEKVTEQETSQSPEDTSTPSVVLEDVELAEPSAFATTIARAREEYPYSIQQPNLTGHTNQVFAVAPTKNLVQAQQSFSQPSPDDVVRKAQQGSKGMSKAVTPAPAVTEPAAEDTPIPKKANRPRKGRPFTATKKHLSLVVVGHVDAGKSTLFGRLLYDLGHIDERSMQKLKKESEKIQKSSFAFAWAMDSSDEERQRGVTIDIATNSFETEASEFTILDAPGHKDFVPNMIAGASLADFAVLVIDASTGAFESGFDAAGQTKEHAILIRALGIQRVLVAVNKLDNIDWSRDRFNDIQVQLSTFMTQTGFEAVNLAFVPCSGLSGINVTKPGESGLGAWYKGKTLLQEMEAVPATVRNDHGPFRLMLSDIQSSPNSSNIAVTGRICSGEVQKDDVVLCMPSKELAMVKSVLVGSSLQEAAFAGDTATLTLSQIDPMHLRTGDVLCHADMPLDNATKFKARVVTFQVLRPLLAGSSIIIHRGRSDVPGVIKSLEIVDKSADGAGPAKQESLKKVRHVVGNTQAILEIELVRGVLPLEPFSANKDIGRVILRREGETVAAGVVMEIC